MSALTAMYARATMILAVIRYTDSIITTKHEIEEHIDMSDKDGMMDMAIVNELKELIEKDPRTHAMWIAGSIADGHADALSDVDLWVNVDDAAHKELYVLIETFLETKGNLDTRLGRNLDGPFTHRVYHLEGMNPYHFIEFTLVNHSDAYHPSEGNRTFITLFDKDDTLKNESKTVDTEAEETERSARKQSLIDKIAVGYISVEKEILRGQFMDAMHNYEFWLVTPVIELARIKHSPLKTSFGLKHGNRDLPKEVADEIQSLYTIKSLADLSNKIEEVKKMVAIYS